MDIKLIVFKWLGLEGRFDVIRFRLEVMQNRIDRLMLDIEGISLAHKAGGGAPSVDERPNKIHQKIAEVEAEIAVLARTPMGEACRIVSDVNNGVFVSHDNVVGALKTIAAYKKIPRSRKK